MSYYEFASLFWSFTILAGLWLVFAASLWTSAIGQTPRKRLQAMRRSVRSSLDSVGTKLFPENPSSASSPIPSSPSHPSWPGLR